MAPGYFRKLFISGIVGWALLSGGSAGAQELDNPRCAFLFQNYEAITQSFGANSRRRDASAPGPVMDAARMLRMGNCLTFSDALAGLDGIGPEAGAAARGNSGAAITPISLHVGIVTSSQDDAAARAFFERQGLKARSVGAAGLGRRIYVGPFSSAGALEAGRALALQAGFAYPYPARF